MLTDRWTDLVRGLFLYCGCCHAKLEMGKIISEKCANPHCTRHVYMCQSCFALSLTVGITPQHQTGECSERGNSNRFDGQLFSWIPGGCTVTGRKIESCPKCGGKHCEGAWCGDRKEPFNCEVIPDANR